MSTTPFRQGSNETHPSFLNITQSLNANLSETVLNNAGVLAVNQTRVASTHVFAFFRRTLLNSCARPCLEVIVKQDRLQSIIGSHWPCYPPICCPGPLQGLHSAYEHCHWQGSELLSGTFDTRKSSWKRHIWGSSNDTRTEY